ncbi:hypothetical protein QA802_05640 [Streptomyces sp. B21-105]|uniref:hypothetical protein n=1 Tax=Streptomyces sp. B21-105 TaxID=3039417 RepID=UPI002FF2716A
MTWTDAADMEPGDVIGILGVDHVFRARRLRRTGTLRPATRRPRTHSTTPRRRQYR